MEHNHPSRKIRLKCRFDSDIRTVVITPTTQISEVKKRLSSDFGFDVVLKYEDRDGDLITLSTQNDLNDLFYYDNIDTLNVVISESISLPQLNLKPIPVKGNGNGYQSLGVSRDWSARASASTALTPNNHNLPRFSGPQTRTTERFPSISNNNNDSSLLNRFQEHHDIRWKKAEVLGQGAFGIVYLGLNIDTGELMAVKQMATEEVSKKELSSLENEINLLRNLRHPNIVRYIGTELTTTSLSIFLEYVPGGSLKALIDKFGQLEEAVVKSYTRQLLLGLEYLHRNGIAHRDIKGANCLVGNDGVIKLADFGSSKHWRPSPSSSNAATGLLAAGGNSAPSGDLKGTPAWMAPEVIRDQGSNISWRKADIWSLGCTTLEMSTGKPPWSQFSNPVTILYHIACQETFPEYPRPASVELVTFLNMCFQRDPQVRPDVTSLLLHPFVAAAGMSTTWGGQGGLMVRPSTMSTLMQSEDNNMSFTRQSMQWGHAGLSSASMHRRQYSDDRGPTMNPVVVPLSLNLPVSTFPDISRSRSSSQSNVVPPIVSGNGSTPRAGDMMPPTSARSINTLNSNVSNSSTVSGGNQNAPFQYAINPAAAIFQRNNSLTSPSSMLTDSLNTRSGKGNNGNDSGQSTPRVFARQRALTEDDYFHEVVAPHLAHSVDSDLLEKDHPENTGNNKSHRVPSPNEAHNNALNDGYLSDFTAGSLDTDSNIRHHHSSTRNQQQHHLPSSKHSALSETEDSQTNILPNITKESDVMGTMIDVSSELSANLLGNVVGPAVLAENAKIKSSAKKARTRRVSRGTGNNNSNENKRLMSSNFGGGLSSNEQETNIVSASPVVRTTKSTVTRNVSMNNARQSSARKAPENSLRIPIDPTKSVSFDVQESMDKQPILSKKGRNSSTPSTIDNGMYSDSDDIVDTIADTYLRGRRKDDNSTKQWPQSHQKVSYNTVAPSRHYTEVLDDATDGGEGIEEELESLDGGYYDDDLVIGTSTNTETMPVTTKPKLQFDANTMAMSSLDAADMDDTNYYTKNTLPLTGPSTTGTHASPLLSSSGKLKKTLHNEYKQDILSTKASDSWHDTDDMTIQSLEKSQADGLFLGHDGGGIPLLERMSLDVVDALSLASRGHPSTLSRGGGNNNIPIVTASIEMAKPGQQDILSLEIVPSRISTSVPTKGSASNTRQQTATRTNRNSIGTRNGKLSIDTTGPPSPNRKGTRYKGNNLHASVSTGDKKESIMSSNTFNSGFDGNDPLDLSCDSLEASLHISGVNALAHSRTNLHSNTINGPLSITAGPAPGTANHPSTATAAYSRASRRRTTSHDTTAVTPVSSTLTSNMSTSTLIGNSNATIDELGNVSVGIVVDHKAEITDTMLMQRNHNNNHNIIMNYDVREVTDKDIPDDDDQEEIDTSNSLLRTIGSVDPVVLEEHLASVTRLRAPKKATSFLLSSSLDGTIRLWQGQELRSKMIFDAMQFATGSSTTASTNTTASSTPTAAASAHPSTSEVVHRRVILGSSMDHQQLQQQGGDGGESLQHPPPTSAAPTRSHPAAIRILNLWNDDTAETVWGACSDGHIRVWNGLDARPIRLLKGHEEAITCMEGIDPTSNPMQYSSAFSSSSAIVATGSNDRTIRIWDVRAKKAQVFVFRGHGDNILTLKWFDSGRAIVSGSKDKTIKIWDTRAGRLRTSIEKHFGAVHTIRVVSDTLSGGGGSNALASSIGTAGAPSGGGNTAANTNKYEIPSFISAGRDSMLHFWNANGDCITSQTAHRGSVTYLSDINHSFYHYRPMSANYTIVPMILSIGSDNLIKVWDLKRGKCMSEISTANPANPTTASGNSNITKAAWCGNAFLTASSTGHIKLLDRSIPGESTMMQQDAKLASSISSEWSSQDMPSHSQNCTDLVSMDNMAACSSKSGRIFRWNW